MTFIGRNLLLFFLFLIGPYSAVTAQLEPNVYIHHAKMGDNPLVYQWMIDNDYAILSMYKTSPPEFVGTLGGYYKIKDDTLEIQLEFNSNFAIDSLKEVRIPFSKSDNGLQFFMDGEKDFKAVPKVEQDLDGKWLFAARIAEVNKGRATLNLLHGNHYDFILAIGDDRTDEDTFHALPDDAFTIKVGDVMSAARYYVKRWQDVRDLLSALASAQ